MGKSYTNGDLIRSMTDDQLAKVLLSVNDTGISIPFCKNLPECTVLLDEGEIPDEKCLECVKEWLKCPACTGGGVTTMPKNVKCENCNHLQKNWWCKKAVDSPVPDVERDCPHYWQKTHADLIRAMSDDELALIFQKFCKGMEKCEDCALYSDCAGSDKLKRWQQWMQAPVFKEDMKNGQ